MIVLRTRNTNSYKLTFLDGVKHWKNTDRYILKEIDILFDYLGFVHACKVINSMLFDPQHDHPRAGACWQMVGQLSPDPQREPNAKEISLNYLFINLLTLRAFNVPENKSNNKFNK